MTASDLPAFRLDSKAVIVTGGYGQIGRAMARAALASGARVAVVEPRASASLTERAFGTLADNPNLIALEADVTDAASLERARDVILNRFGGIDGLVNNAALDSPPDASPADNGPFECFPVSSFERVMDVNVKGVFLCCQTFGAVMAEQQSGSIINIASIYGTVSPDQSLYQYRRDRGEDFYKPVAYSVSKSALYNLTRYLAVYWGPKGVRSNTLTFAGVYNNQDPEFIANYQRKIPLDRGRTHAHLHRMAEPGDFAGPTVFLLSDASAYMTGADLRVDGGFLSI